MDVQLLAPRVQGRQQTGHGPQVLRIGQQFRQGLRAAVKQ
jgi:hypothetical protein